MNTDLEKALRETLNAQARRAPIPDRASISTQNQVRSTLLSWRVAAAALSAVAAVALSVTLTNWVRSESNAPPAVTPSETNDPPSATLDRGAPPKAAFARGSEVWLAGQVVADFNEPIVALARAGGTIVVRSQSGVVWAVDEQGDRRELGRDAIAGPTLDGGGNHAVWISENDHGSYQAQWRSVYNSGPGYEGSASLAGIDGCCATAIAIDTDQFGTVYLGSSGGIFAWDAFGEEAAGDPPRLIEGTRNLTLLQAFDRTLVAQSADGQPELGRYEPSTNRYLRDQALPASIFHLSSTWAIGLDAEGQLEVYDVKLESSFDPNGVAITTPRVGELRLSVPIPDGWSTNSVTQEDENALLVDTIDAAGNRYWVRCSTTEKRCESAQPLESADVLPKA